jgi:ribonuclease VapC
MTGVRKPAMNEGFLLDASALLALVRREPGADVVREVLPNARIHAVNLAEVVKKLAEIGVPRNEIELSIEELQIPVEEALTAAQATEVGLLAAGSRPQGLSLGDCVCLGVAESLALTAVTAERRWPGAFGGGREILLIR